MGKGYVKIICFMFVLVVGIFVLPESSDASDWKHYERGVSLMKSGKYNEAIVELEKAASISPKASTLRKLAESYEKNGQYQKAAETYYREAEVHKKRGDQNTYLAVKNLADALNTEIELFAVQEMQQANQSLGKYEPMSGMYVGAYIEQDKLASEGAGKYSKFNSLTGKDHAIFFTYHNYGAPFPSQFVKSVADAGGAVQLALEPNNGLGVVQDNEYLRQFAKDAKASGVPIFLRFASEMNGDWVAWHKDPTLYKQKFSLVAKVMREEAPNVAMVWVPNSVPSHNIDAYYPGDQAVDWVGLNLYSVPFFNGKASEPADHVNPLDLLDDFYKKYASKKPMMIGEYAASHFTSVGNRDVTTFGMTKMKMFYHGLQMKYPRVKAVHWFSVDTLTAPYVAQDRKLNNYSLTVNAKMLQAYKEVLSDPYFRSKVVNGPLVESEQGTSSVAKSLQGATVFDSVRGMGFAKTYEPYISKVVYLLNGTKLSESSQYPFAFSIDYGKLKSGTNRLEAVVYDSKGREAGRKAVTFTKGPKMTKAEKNAIYLFVGEKTVFTEHGASQLLAAVYEKDGRSLVPLRFVSETLGASVDWNGQLRQITITDKSKKIVLKEGSKTVSVNGQSRTIDVPAEIRNGTTFVPLRFVTEVLGASVSYHAETGGIEIKF